MMELNLADISWAQIQLQRFTYKPSWKMQLMEPPTPWDDPYIRIEFMAENTYRPGHTITISARERMPAPIIQRRDEERFARYLLDCLFRVERHEAQEWFRRDGVMLYDPHKEG